MESVRVYRLMSILRILVLKILLASRRLCVGVGTLVLATCVPSHSNNVQVSWPRWQEPTSGCNGPYYRPLLSGEGVGSWLHVGHQPQKAHPHLDLLRSLSALRVPAREEAGSSSSLWIILSVKISIRLYGEPILQSFTLGLLAQLFLAHQNRLQCQSRDQKAHA